jgi:hypothetical protein
MRKWENVQDRWRRKRREGGNRGIEMGRWGQEEYNNVEGI